MVKWDEEKITCDFLWSENDGYVGDVLSMCIPYDMPRNDSVLSMWNEKFVEIDVEEYGRQGVLKNGSDSNV